MCLCIQFEWIISGNLCSLLSSSCSFIFVESVVYSFKYKVCKCKHKFVEMHKYNMQFVVCLLQGCKGWFNFQLPGKSEKYSEKLTFLKTSLMFVGSCE